MPTLQEGQSADITVPEGFALDWWTTGKANLCDPVNGHFGRDQVRSTAEPFGPVAKDTPMRITALQGDAGFKYRLHNPHAYGPHAPLLSANTAPAAPEADEPRVIRLSGRPAYWDGDAWVPAVPVSATWDQQLGRWRGV